MTVIGDVLVVNTMRATGFTREDYALRHHAATWQHCQGDKILTIILNLTSKDL